MFLLTHAAIEFQGQLLAMRFPTISTLRFIEAGYHQRVFAVLPLANHRREPATDRAALFSVGLAPDLSKFQTLRWIANAARSLANRSFSAPDSMVFREPMRCEPPNTLCLNSVRGFLIPFAKRVTFFIGRARGQRRGCRGVGGDANFCPRSYIYSRSLLSGNWVGKMMQVVFAVHTQDC